MGNVVLITGCRSGFGLATARAAGRAGWTVYAGLHDLGTADALREATAGLDVRPLPLDVTDRAQRDAALARIDTEVGRLDALVNNAGRGLGGFLELIEEDELRALFDLNVFAPFALTRAALPLMRRSGPGTIVMISSTSGLMAIPGLGAYASTKFAIEGMAEAWRHELNLFGIHMVLVEPGAFATDIFDRNRRVCRNAERPGAYAPWAEGAQRVFGGVAERIAGDPADVASLIVSLLEHPNPRLRWPIGPGARLRDFARRFVPFRLVELAAKAAFARARTR